MEEDESTTLCHDNEDLDLDLLDFLIMRMGPLKHRLKTPIFSHIAMCLLHLAGAHIWDSIQTECRL